MLQLIALAADFPRARQTTNGTRSGATQSRSLHTPRLEPLEKRALLSAISGSVLRDISGNGNSPDDKPLAGISVKLFKDANGNGKLDAADGAAIAGKTTSASGGFSFTSLPTGRYLLKELTPARQISTAPASGVLAVNAAKDKTYAANTFANYVGVFDPSAISNISYTINGTTTVTTLPGNVHENDVVTVNFTVAAGKTVELSLVSYHNPLNSNTAAALLQQELFDSDTGVFTAGQHSLTVLIPDCFFQLDFVGGQPIGEFVPPNITYSAQNRLISTTLGGVHQCVPEQEHIDGRMTGGGSIFLPSGATGGAAGTRVTHGFELHCAQASAKGGPIEDVNNHLEINWNQSQFHLTSLTSVECFETSIVQAPPKSAPIDTLQGVGNGRFSGTFNGQTYKDVSARIEFTLTDGGPVNGEPGVFDTAKYKIIVLDANQNGVANDPVTVLDTTQAVLLTFGNHQAHKEIAPLTGNTSVLT